MTLQDCWYISSTLIYLATQIFRIQSLLLARPGLPGEIAPVQAHVPWRNVPALILFFRCDSFAVWLSCLNFAHAHTLILEFARRCGPPRFAQNPVRHKTFQKDLELSITPFLLFSSISGKCWTRFEFLEDLPALLALVALTTAGFIPVPIFCFPDTFH